MQLSKWRAPNGKVYNLPTQFVINYNLAPGKLQQVINNAFMSYARAWGNKDRDLRTYGKATASRICAQANTSWLRVQDCVIRAHWQGLA